MTLDGLFDRLKLADPIAVEGRVRALVGLSIRASIPGVRLGELVEIARRGQGALLAEVVATAKQLAVQHCGGEFRLVFNEGESAGQTVFHVHAHVLGADPGGALPEGSLGQ